MIWTEKGGSKTRACKGMFFESLFSTQTQFFLSFARKTASGDEFLIECAICANWPRAVGVLVVDLRDSCFALKYTDQTPWFAMICGSLCRGTCLATLIKDGKSESEEA